MHQFFVNGNVNQFFPIRLAVPDLLTDISSRNMGDIIRYGDLVHFITHATAIIDGSDIRDDDHPYQWIITVHRFPQILYLVSI